MYRLYIDIPLTNDLTQSTKISKEVISKLESIEINGVKIVQYKLSHDLDRSNKNYLDINENGHCTNKKLKIVYDEIKTMQ
jgi:hypothetical protein